MTYRARSWRLRNYATRPAAIVSAMLFAVGALAVSNPSLHRALFVWNASASAPIGLYRVYHDRAFARGDLVLASPPRDVAAFAASRHYLPLGVPMVKLVVALSSDTVCARRDVIFFNGQPVTTRLHSDSRGRALPRWYGCRTLKDGEVFLLMPTVRASFDGRYFGPTLLTQIAGRLVPVWTY